MLLREGNNFWSVDIFLSMWIGQECVHEGKMERDKFHNLEKISRCWGNTQPTAQSNKDSTNCFLLGDRKVEAICNFCMT